MRTTLRQQDVEYVLAEAADDIRRANEAEADGIDGVLRHYAAGLPDGKFRSIVGPHFIAEPKSEQRRVKEDLQRIRHMREGWGS